MPSFVLLPYLFRRRPLCCTHIANAGGLLSSGIPGGRPSHTGRIRRDLGEFFGARVVGRQSPGQIDRVVSAPPVPTGYRFVESRNFCAYIVTTIYQIS